MRFGPDDVGAAFPRFKEFSRFRANELMKPGIAERDRALGHRGTAHLAFRFPYSLLPTRYSPEKISKFRASELMKTGIVEHDQGHGQLVSCTPPAAANKSSNFDERTDETRSYPVSAMTWTTHTEGCNR